MANVSVNLDAVAKILVELDLDNTVLSSCTDEDDLDTVQYCSDRIGEHIEGLKNLLFYKPFQETQNDKEDS